MNIIIMFLYKNYNNNSNSNYYFIIIFIIIFLLIIINIYNTGYIAPGNEARKQHLRSQWPYFSFVHLIIFLSSMNSK